MLWLLLACGAPEPDWSAAPDPGIVTTARVGEEAPDFTLWTLDATPWTLSEQRGRVVVLEWFSATCPFVKEAHSSGALEDLPAEAVAAGTVWVGVHSNRVGLSGSDVGSLGRAASRWGLPGPVLRDATGQVGKAYGATVTPEIWVVDEAGMLVYNGAPDNAPMGRAAGSRSPWLASALEATRAGRAVPTPETQPWGCTIKY